jgi:hypothetical protein
MVMKRTIAVEVSIQAVSPESMGEGVIGIIVGMLEGKLGANVESGIKTHKKTGNEKK